MTAATRVWLVYSGAWGLVGALSWTTAAVYFIRDVGMSPLQLVLAGTALEVAYFLFEVPTGVVADLRSRKLSVVVAAFVSGAAMLLIGAVPEVGAVLAGMALWGFGWTFRSGAEDAWLADEVGESALGPAYQRGAQVGRVTGLVGIAAAVGLAMVDLRLPFLVAGAVTVMLGLYLAVAMPETGFTPARSAELTAPLRQATATLRQGGRLVRAGGLPEGRDLKCFFPGGSSAPVLTKEHLDLPFTYEAMAEAGSMLGTASMIVVDDSQPLVPLALRLAEFYRHESCGKCVPCREGTNWTVKMLERIDEGEGTPMDLDILEQVQGNIMGNCLCVLGDSMAMPVSSMLKHFREEFEQHMEAARARRELIEFEALGAPELASVPEAGAA